MLAELISEPFPGFDRNAIIFLKALSSTKNNNKEWFDKHRNRYEKYLKQPMRKLIDSLAPELKKIDKNIVANYKSIFRINRDIRFSKNKTPYKDQYSAAFAFNKVKSAEVPKFYFHFNKSEFLFAACQYSSDPDKLKKIRAYIYKNFNPFKKIINERNFYSEFNEVCGDSLTNLPKVFQAERITDCELAGFLKMKQYYVFKEYPVEVIFEPDITGLILSNIRITYDFNKFLYEAAL